MKIDYLDAILKLRSKLNVSQEELAEMFYISFSYVNRLENRRYMTKTIKLKLSKLFKEMK